MFLGWKSPFPKKYMDICNTKEDMVVHKSMQLIQLHDPQSVGAKTLSETSKQQTWNFNTETFTKGK